jgi:hypothetical protein
MTERTMMTIADNEAHETVKLVPPWADDEAAAVGQPSRRS